MEKRIITEELLEQYENHMYEEEKQSSTIRKYMCDIRKLQQYAGSCEITKSLMIRYKEYLSGEKKYKDRSVNSFLVAANCFLQYMGWGDATVKLIRVQNEVFCPEEKALSRQEYKKLLMAAKAKGKRRLVMILQTICATGIRVSELQHITVGVVLQGYMDIHSKGKSRRVFLPKKLREALRRYIRESKIAVGPVFVTAGGNAVDRSNIWREMKGICEEAGVGEEKVFPHNLRHLFAQCFYELGKDIAKLADVLGHSSIETTRIYIKTTGAEHLQQLEKMNLAFG